MTEINVVYKEERRNQFVAQGTCPLEMILRFQIHVNKTLDMYKKSKTNSWTEMVTEWWNDTRPPHGRLFLTQKYDQHYLLNLGRYEFIHESVEMLKRLGIEIQPNLEYVTVNTHELTDRKSTRLNSSHT